MSHRSWVELRLTIELSMGQGGGYDIDGPMALAPATVADSELSFVDVVGDIAWGHILWRTPDLLVIVVAIFLLCFTIIHTVSYADSVPVSCDRVCRKIALFITTRDLR